MPPAVAELVFVRSFHHVTPSVPPPLPKSQRQGGGVRFTVGLLLGLVIGAVIGCYVAYTVPPPPSLGIRGGPTSSDARLQKIQKPRISWNEHAYRIQNSEVTVAGDMIKRVELGRGTAIITYFNKTDAATKPSYEFRLISAYGVEIARFEDKWWVQTIAPGDTHQENKSFYQNRVADILEFSSVILPSDWSEPAWLVIAGTHP